MRAPSCKVLFAAAALAVAGCGSAPSSAEDFEGEQGNVAQVIEDIEAASKQRDAAQICTDYLAKPLADEIAQGGRNCGSELKKAIEDADVFELDVTRVDVTGTNATAQVKGEDEDEAGVVRTFELTKQGGSWRVTSFG